MPDTAAHRRLPAWLLGSGLIAVAMAVMNLSTYGFTMLAARVLGPGEYGELAAVMGLLLVVNVASLGLQATGARRVSAAPGSPRAGETSLLRATYQTAAAVGLLTVLAIPVVTVALRLDTWLTALMIAATSVPLTVMGGLAGILQGERRWVPLAGVYLGVGLGRIGFGGLGLAVGHDTFSAMVGVTFGAVVPVLLGYAGLRRRQGAGDEPPPPEAPAAPVDQSVVRELVHNSHALLAFFALSNADVVIARIALADTPSGLYAAGLILAKAVLFLPQFVVVVAFPTMAAAGAARRLHLQGLGVVLAIGAAATLGAALLPRLAVLFVGGPAYGGLEPVIGGFAAVGTVLAMTQLMVYDVVAAQQRRAVTVVWAGLVVLFVAAVVIGSVTSLLTTVLAVEATVLVVLVALSLRRTAHPGRGAPTG